MRSLSSHDISSHLINAINIWHRGSHHTPEKNFALNLTSSFFSRLFMLRALVLGVELMHFSSRSFVWWWKMCVYAFKAGKNSNPREEESKKIHTRFSLIFLFLEDGLFKRINVIAFWMKLENLIPCEKISYKKFALFELSRIFLLISNGPNGARRIKDSSHTPRHTHSQSEV